VNRVPGAGEVRLNFASDDAVKQTRFLAQNVFEEDLSAVVAQRVTSPVVAVLTTAIARVAIFDENRIGTVLTHHVQRMPDASDADATPIRTFFLGRNTDTNGSPNRAA